MSFHSLATNFLLATTFLHTHPFASKFVYLISSYFWKKFNCRLLLFISSTFLFLFSKLSQLTRQLSPSNHLLASPTTDRDPDLCTLSTSIRAIHYRSPRCLPYDLQRLATRGSGPVQTPSAPTTLAVPRRVLLLLVDTETSRPWPTINTCPSRLEVRAKVLMMIIHHCQADQTLPSPPATLSRLVALSHWDLGLSPEMIALETSNHKTTILVLRLISTAQTMSTPPAASLQRT